MEFQQLITPILEKLDPDSPRFDPPLVAIFAHLENPDTGQIEFGTGIRLQTILQEFQSLTPPREWAKKRLGERAILQFMAIRITEDLYRRFSGEEPVVTSWGENRSDREDAYRRLLEQFCSDVGLPIQGIEDRFKGYASETRQRGN